MRLSAGEWEQVEALLPEALMLPRAERESFLRQKCGDSPHLRAELESLLAASGSAEEFLANPIGLSAPVQGAPLAPGTCLGPWKVGERIGRGGMGEVYAAERADGQFEMDAALKILKRGLDTDQLLRRFERERNILARLSHPNIARLLDAGATTDHRPYYVMERVAGQSITAYCHERALGVRDVLALMARVCEAVDAAHRSLVVHRDLKPSNVLVTDAGDVKLLDFGIAKVLAEEGDGTRTRGQDTMLSPAYAAPEQMLGGIVSTATDVYALGVMLFMLLTGRMPHQRDGLPLVTVVANLSRETTERPSRVVAHDPLGRIQARELAGDLDLIVLKALHADPERRYRSAHDLGVDLQCYLEYRPVGARPDSFGYRLRRLLQRHPLSSAAAGLAVLALMVGFGVALWQAGVARDQARAARRALATTNAVSDFLNEDIIAGADPDKGPVKDISLRVLLDRAGSTVDQRFVNEPESAAKVHLQLGIAYSALGDYPAAIPHLHKAVQLSGSSVAADEARIYLARVMATEGRGVESCSLRRASAAALAERVAADDVRLLAVRADVAQGCEDDRDQAIEELADVVATFEKRGFTNHREYERALGSLTSTLEMKGDFAAAAVQARKLIEHLSVTAGLHHVRTARWRTVFAEVLTNLGALAEADLQLEAARQDFAAWGDGPYLADVYAQIALLRVEQGRFREAEEAIRACFGLPGGVHFNGLKPVLSEALLRQNRVGEAIALARETVAAIRSSSGKLDWYQLKLLGSWAEALRRQGKAVEARSVIASMTPQEWNGVVESAKPDIDVVRARLLIEEGKTAEARVLLQATLAILVKYGSPDSWRITEVKGILATLEA